MSESFGGNDLEGFVPPQHVGQQYPGPSGSGHRKGRRGGRVPRQPPQQVGQLLRERQRLAIQQWRRLPGQAQRTDPAFRSATERTPERAGHSEIAIGRVAGDERQARAVVASEKRVQAEILVGDIGEMPVQAHLAGVTQNLSQLAMRQRRKPHIAIDRGRQAVLDHPGAERLGGDDVLERPHPDRNKPRDDRAEYPGELKRRRWPHARDPRRENQKRRDEERETPSRERM